MKNKIFLLVALALIFGLFAGCTPGETPNTDASHLSDAENTDQTDIQPSFTATSFEELSEAQLQPYFELITETVTEYCSLRTDTEGFQVQDGAVIPTDEALQTLEDLPLSEDLRSLLEKKLIYESTMTAVAGEYKTNLSTECSIAEWQVIDRVLLCTVNATTRYQYSFAASATLSGESFQVILEHPQEPLLTYFYNSDPGSGFDSTVRGWGLELAEKEPRLASQDKASLDGKINDALRSVFQAAEQNKETFPTP